MFKVLAILLIGSLSFAAEVSNPQVKSDFSLIEEQMETSLFGVCSWDEKVFTTPEPNEFYTEILCSDGSYSYKFGTWLMYGEQTTLRAESYAVSNANKWFCLMEGGIEQGSVYSQMACTQLE